MRQKIQEAPCVESLCSSNLYRLPKMYLKLINLIRIRPSIEMSYHTIKMSSLESKFL